jgi:hypothetical protein
VGKLFLLVVFVVNVYANDLLRGTWVVKEYTADISSRPFYLLEMQLRIDDNGKVEGSFEYDFQWFTKVEASQHFEATLIDNTFQFPFVSSFTNAKVCIQIRIHKDCSLEWKLIKKPRNKGYYLPDKKHIPVSTLRVNKLCKMPNF